MEAALIRISSHFRARAYVHPSEHLVPALLPGVSPFASNSHLSAFVVPDKAVVDGLMVPIAFFDKRHESIDAL